MMPEKRQKGMLFVELDRLCSTFDGYYNFCVEKNLIADLRGKSCHKCGVGKFTLVKDNCYKLDGHVYRCTNRKGTSGRAKCYTKVSIRKGSWFEKSHLSIPQILKLTYLWAYEAENRLIQREAEIGGCATIVDWKNFCREVCAAVFKQDMQENKLGGEGKIVEIEESKFGKRKYNRGKAVDGKWVFGGIEQGTDNMFMEVVEDRTKETLWALIEKYIAPGTIIWSDKWRSYQGLENVGYRHETVNHSKEFKSASGVCTNSIEGSWNAVKRSFPKMGTSKKLYEGYLAEYLMRRRHMKPFNYRFETFLDKITKVYSPKSLRPTDYEELSNGEQLEPHGRRSCFSEALHF